LNNKSACARIMGIAPQTLFRKLKERRKEQEELVKNPVEWV